MTSKFMPEIEDVITNYANLLASSKSSGANLKLLDVTKYKVCESRNNLYIVKSLKSKRPCVAILPKCLASSFNIVLPFEDKDFSFEAMTIAVYSSEKEQESNGARMAIVCTKPELIALKEEFVFAENERSMVALVENINAKTGITLRFSN